MVDEFISPNWHPVLMHFPMGLLIAGVVVELLSLVRRGEKFRAAGRWMILLGAMLSLPTVAAGIYAFRDVVAPGMPDVRWEEAARQNTWPPEQWDHMTDHIWLTAVAAFLFVGVATAYLALSDRLRRILYWPLLIVLLAGVGVVGAAAWHGGEAVYRYGTAVNPEVLAVGVAKAHAQAGDQRIGRAWRRSDGPGNPGRGDEG